jgi:hypothetical protein
MGRRSSRRADAIAVGSPALAVVDEEREALADLLADLLIAQLEDQQESAR